MNRGLERLLLMWVGLSFAFVCFINWHLRDVWLHYFWIASGLLFLIAAIVRRSWGLLLLVAALWWGPNSVFSYSPYTHSLIPTARVIGIWSDGEQTVRAVEFADKSLALVMEKDGQWTCHELKYANTPACKHIRQIIGKDDAR